MRGRPFRSSLLLAALSGCSFGFGDSGGCVAPLAPPNGALGKANFTYVCSCAASPSDDAWCDLGSGSALPDVAVGAPFRLSSDTGSPQPAIPALAQPASTGWMLPQPGWLGFIVYDNSTVLDFVHIRARNIASVLLAAAPPSPVQVGAVTVVTATAVADDGTILAGSIPCSFTSSNVNVATVFGQGRVGRVKATADGDVTLSVTCSGQQASLPLHFEVLSDAAAADVSNESGGADDGPGDSPLEGQRDGEAGADSTLDVSPDAGDSGPIADAEGG